MRSTRRPIGDVLYLVALALVIVGVVVADDLDDYGGATSRDRWLLFGAASLAASLVLAAGARGQPVMFVDLPGLLFNGRGHRRLGWSLRGALAARLGLTAALGAVVGFAVSRPLAASGADGRCPATADALRSRTMASHRALIVAASSADQLANLRDRPPLLIAADSGLHAVLDRGWTPDLVIGDLDSATAAAVETARSAGAAVETADIGKDETDLELALAAAITRGATDLRIVVRSDGRLDHQLANLAVLAAPQFAAAQISGAIGEHEVWVIRGERQLQLEPGQPFALVPIGGPARVTSSGVAFPLAGEELSPFSGRGIANTVTDPVVRLRVDRGVVIALSTPTEPSGPDDAPR